MEKPRLENNLSGATLEPLLTAEDPIIDGVSVYGDDLSGFQYSNIEVRNSRLDRLMGIGTKIRNFTGLDLVFNGCDFSNSNFSGCYFNRVEFNDCKFLGSNLSDAIFKNTSFTDCLMTMANFTKSKLEDVKFFNVQLSSADFIYSILKKVSFRECDIENLNLSVKVLEKVDISSSTFSSISFDFTKAKGLTIDELQAVLFLQKLGFTIK